MTAPAHTPPSGSPQAVVFDLGKVLLDFDYGIAIRRFLSQVRVSLQRMHELINQSPLLLQFEQGLMSTEEFFARVKAASGYAGNADEFRALFADIFSEIPPMVALHAEVRRRGIPTYVFSNTNELAIQHIRARFDFFHQFDGYILSYEHGALKPSPELYAVVERIAGRRGAELFYLDDRPENIAAALQRGWQALLHESPEQSRAALQRAGVLD